MKTPFSKLRGFTLVEIMVVMSIVLVLATIMLRDTPARILQGQIDAEEALLDSFVADINRSFESTDYADRNIAAFAGTIPGTDSPTSFSTSLATPTNTASNDWFAKIGRLRGVTPAIGSAPSTSAQPELARIVFNDRGRTRYLFAGPTTEGDHQRFLLVSILGDDALTLPTYSSSSTWFDAIWNHNFDTDQASLPSYWGSNLSADQQSAWLDGIGDGSNLRRLRLRRIVLPKFTVTINNNHTSENAYVYYNGALGMTTVAGEGTETTGPIYQGRRIVVQLGTSAGTAVQRYDWILRKDSTVTVE